MCKKKKICSIQEYRKINPNAKLNIKIKIEKKKSGGLINKIIGLYLIDVG